MCVFVCASECAVNSEELIYSCPLEKMVNFSTSAAARFSIFLYLCYMCVCPITASQRTLVFLFPTALSLSFLPISFTQIPLFPLKSLVLQEPHLFMLPGSRCHFQLLAKSSFLKINSLDKLKKIN